MSNDCPICLDEMNSYDQAHPTLCSKRCGYNFCMNCIDHLIQMSKGPIEEASDGNMAVKIQLHCPQCRSDLTESIGDTLLLRRRESAEAVLDTNDSELSATELRLKFSMESTETAEAVERARSREADYMNKISPTTPTKKSTTPTQPPLDTALFSGLEFAMTDVEQRYVTELMTSGSVSKLSQAAQILNSIAVMSLQGVTPSMRSQALPPATPKRAPTSHRTLQSGRSNAAVGRALAMSKTGKERELEKREKLLAAFRKQHPLPVRMPSYVQLSATGNPYAKRYFITFADDEWDGTIADAFSRVYIDRKNRVTHMPVKTFGVENVLQSENDGDNGGPRKRVVVASIRAEAGRQGIVKGDIVTHFNGELFTGNAEDLRQAIAAFNTRGDSETFSIVVNAEEGTAEVIRFRAVKFNKLMA